MPALAAQARSQIDPSLFVKGVAWARRVDAVDVRQSWA
jgi:hypothetical protein